MLKRGIYRHHHEIDYVERTVYMGDIVLEVHETKTAFVLTLLEQQVRYDAPQIDDMFRKSNRVVIKKNGSKHAMAFCDGQDDWFCLYPYRVGTPYAFTHEDTIKELEEFARRAKGEEESG